MNKYKFVSAMLAALVILSSGAGAGVNGSSDKVPMTITVDTGNRTGHLVYKELYYRKDGTGNLTYDTGRVYFNGTINKTRIYINILRPLDQSGKPYTDPYIRVVATLDNKTIINNWYKSPSTDSKPVNNKKTPGFAALFALIAIVLVMRRRKPPHHCSGAR